MRHANGWRLVAAWALAIAAVLVAGCSGGDSGGDGAVQRPAVVGKRPLAADGPPVRLYGTTPSLAGRDTLAAISVATGTQSVVGGAGATIRVVSMDFDPLTGFFYGVTPSTVPGDLVRIDAATGTSAAVATIHLANGVPAQLVALAFGKDGTLIAGTATAIGRVDRARELFTPVINVPSDRQLVALDLAPSGVLYAVYRLTQGGGQFLMTIDPVSWGVNRQVGLIPHATVGSVVRDIDAASDGALYAATGNNALLRIDVDSGSMTLVGAGSPAFLNSLASIADSDPSALFDWAERTYPDVFPSHRASQAATPYTYRYYPETDTYLGVDGTAVALLGPVTGGRITVVGRVADFTCRVRPGDCAAPVITSPPSAKSVPEAQVANFTVSVSGTPPPDYQWQRSDDGGLTYTNLAGANRSSYSTPATTAADNGRMYRVRVSNQAGSAVSAAATLAVRPAPPPIFTGVHDIYDFVTHCPTNDPTYAAIRRDFQLLNNGQPFTGSVTCSEPYSTMPPEQMTDELLTLQTLRLIYTMGIGTEGKLPWTPLGLYDWMRSQIAGVNIVDAQGNSSCCTVINGRKFMTVSRKATASLGFYRDWVGLAGWVALMAHETRHAAGYVHTTGCPSFPLPTDASGCDPTYDEANLGSYGIQRWLYAHWATGEINVGLACGTPAQAQQFAVQMANGANGYRTRFVTGAPDDIVATQPYGGMCAGP